MRARSLALLLLAGCSADLAPLASDDPSDAAAELETPDTPTDEATETAFVDVVEVDTSTRDTAAPPDGRAESSIDSAPTDTRDACVTRCLAPAGVPLGYFCSKGADCCSGNCAPPENRCAPPADPAGWSECK